MRRTLFSTLALATLLTVPAVAEGRHRGPHGGDFAERIGERHAERLTRALDLTEPQQQELDRLQAQLGDAVRPIFDSMRATKDELEALLETADPDPAQVGSKTIALHRAKQQMKGAHEAFEAGIVAMLDETQRSQFEALREARGEHGDRWGGPFGFRGHGGGAGERD